MITTGETLSMDALSMDALSMDAEVLVIGS